MSAKPETTNSHRDDRHIDTAHVRAGADVDVVLVRIALALERIADRLASSGASVAAGSCVSNDLLDLAGVAARFGVSTRWVQRHLRPSFRASARGKAWYRVVDVEEQIASPAQVDMNRPRKRMAKPGPAKSSMRRTQPEAEIAEVERLMRAAMTKPTRRSR